MHVLLIVVACLHVGHLQYVGAQSPRVFTADPKALAAARASYKGTSGSDATLRPAIDRLVKDARSALKAATPSVTEKKVKPASGDLHDYLSWAPYYWLNPKTGKVEPRDGVKLPNADEDAARLRTVRNHAQSLSLAYYVTGNNTFACKAGDFLRVFFLNAKTKMNPNLNFGQVITGEKEGRPSGLITARMLEDVVDSVGLLDGSSCWTKKDQKGMTDWMEAYLKWLQTSDIGKAESKTTNNHGSWYDAQLVSIALFVGQDKLARKVLSAVGPNRMDVQIGPDGRQPKELKRTRPLNYSVFNLVALSNLAFLGRSVDVDLWRYGKGGSKLETALALLAPYAVPGSKFPLKEIVAFNREDLAIVLMRVAPQYPKNKCLAGSFARFERSKLEEARERLMFVSLPLTGSVPGGKSDGCPAFPST